MYNPINGWTKETIKDHIQANWRGKSINEYGACKYRGQNGTKCAVGLFIPDSKYRPIMDLDFSVKGLLGRHIELEGDMPLDSNAMSTLQIVHDMGKAVISREDKRTNDEILTDLISWVDKNVSEVQK